MSRFCFQGSTLGAENRITLSYQLQHFLTENRRGKGTFKQAMLKTPHPFKLNVKMSEAFSWFNSAP